MTTIKTMSNDQLLMKADLEIDKIVSQLVPLGSLHEYAHPLLLLRAIINIKSQQVDYLKELCDEHSVEYDLEDF